jgi:hypothetical protein
MKTDGPHTRKSRFNIDAIGVTQGVKARARHRKEALLEKERDPLIRYIARHGPTKLRPFDLRASESAICLFHFMHLGIPCRSRTLRLLQVLEKKAEQTRVIIRSGMCGTSTYVGLTYEVVKKRHT